MRKYFPCVKMSICEITFIIKTVFCIFFCLSSFAVLFQVIFRLSLDDINWKVLKKYSIKKVLTDFRDNFFVALIIPINFSNFLDRSGTYMATSAMDRSLKIWDVRMYKCSLDYKLPMVPSQIQFSDRRVLGNFIFVFAIYSNFIYPGNQLLEMDLMLSLLVFSSPI